MTGGSTIHLPSEVRDAHEYLIAKRKLNAMLSRHSVSQKFIKPGDLVQVFIKSKNQRRGAWSQPDSVLEFYQYCRCVSVPG